MSYSFSYVLVRSVDFNYSAYFKNTFIQTYINGHLTYIETKIFTDTKIFYIIYCPSITMFPISLSFEINYIKKKITPVKLIGIVCGSVAVFFSIVGIALCIINKQYKKYDFSSITGEDSISSNYSENQEIKEVSNVNITEVTNDNLDNWL